MVEWVGVLIGAIGVLFDRIERREDRLQQRTDLLKPLLDLYRLVREWERFAEATNSKLAAYLQARTPEERSNVAYQLKEASNLQTERAFDTAAQIGFDLAQRRTGRGPWLGNLAQRRIGALNTDPNETVEYREKLDVLDLIAIYAPDLEEQLSYIIRLRVDQLQHLQELSKMHEPAVDSEVELQQALWPWMENWTVWAQNRLEGRQLPEDTEQLQDTEQLLQGFFKLLENPEQLLQAFEHSGNQLSQLRREIASFIKTHWDPKDVTF